MEWYPNPPQLWYYRWMDGYLDRWTARWTVRKHGEQMDRLGWAGLHLQEITASNHAHGHTRISTTVSLDQLVFESTSDVFTDREIDIISDPRDISFLFYSYSEKSDVFMCVVIAARIET